MAASSVESSTNAESWDADLSAMVRQAGDMPEPSSTTEGKNTSRVGATEPKTKPWGRIMLLLLLGLAVVSYVIGAVRRGDISNLFRRVTLRSTPQVLFLESRQDKALFLETDGDRQRVIVRQPNQSDWRIASQDDFTATNPALSPDGAWVVYLSTRTAPQLVLVPLDRSEYVTYTSAALADFSARNRITVTTICPWTPIAWAADSTRVAFFGCAENPSLSQMFVANVLTATLDLQSGVVTGTLVTGENPRQVLWIGADRVMVTFPATTSDQAETIETFDIP